MELAGKTGRGLTAKDEGGGQRINSRPEAGASLLDLNLHFTTVTCFIAYTNVKHINVYTILKTLCKLCTRAFAPRACAQHFCLGLALPEVEATLPTPGQDGPKRNARLKIVANGCDQCLWPVDVVVGCGHRVGH